MKSILPRVVPWTSNQEFKQVFDLLYSDINQRPDLVQQGVDIVKAWVCRGRIPISVKSTMDLIELQLREMKQQQQGNHGPNVLSQNELRLLYGSALIRFINITEDSLQTGYYAKSLYSIAEEIGLPLHIVQLRHAATHEDLPSLFMLRQASVQALQWLYDSYWSIQINMDSSEEVSDERTYAISEAISNYKEKKKTTLKTKAQDGGQKWSRKLIELLSPEILQDTVIILLLRVGALVPSAKKKRSSLENLTVSEELLQIWLPLLQELDAAFSNFATELISAMVERLDTGSGYVMNKDVMPREHSSFMEADQQDPEKFRQSSYLLTITSWLRFFATQSFTGNRLFEADVSDHILEACLRTPNAYTRSVLQAITKVDHGLEESIKPFITYIDHVASSTQESLNSNSHTTNTKLIIGTIETSMEEEVNELTKKYQDLQEKLGVAEYDEPMDDVSAESRWVLHDKDTWAPCPIGCLPNGKISQLDFVVECDTLMLLN